MLCEKETLDKLGRIPKEKCSNLVIIYVCDYCGTQSEKRYCKYILGRKNIEKDCCNNKECMNKKRSESFIKTHGVSSVGKLSKGKKEPEENKKLRIEKIKSSIKEKYGVDNVFQLDEVKAKSKKTNLDRYGVEYPSQNQGVMNKHRNTMIDRHGVEFPLQSADISKKARNTTLDRYGVEHYAMTEESKKLAKSRRKKIDGLTLHEISEITGKTLSTVSEQVRKFGIEYTLNENIRMSGIEHNFKKWLDSENIKYTFNRKFSDSSNSRSDFIIGKLAIELNGLYWHSDSFLEDKLYHVKKRNDYINNGYTPIFFMEDEILNQFDIVKSVVRNKLGLSNRVFARKCSIQEVTRNEAVNFFKSNHLMSIGNGKVVGLYNNNQLICAMQFINKKTHIEISRFCNLLNHSVIGGFSKLLKHIQKNNNKDIVNFIDLRYGSGSHLSGLGFISTKPYVSFMWTNYRDRFHRMNFPGNSGYDKKLHKIWDCGQQKFILKVNDEQG